MRLFLGIVLLTCLTYPTAAAQEVECTVTISTELVTGEARDNLRDFSAQIQNYINSYRWTREDLGGEKIKCAFTISFTGAPAQNQYTAQAFIGSQRPIYGSDRSTAVLRILDDKWEFAYVPTRQFTHDETTFDPLISFIDFYVFLLIGMDFDSYKIGAGTPYLQKAMDIVNTGRAAGNGWDVTGPTVYTRAQIVDELLNPNFQAFREGIFRYYYRGLDLLYYDQDRARNNIMVALEKIGSLPSKINQPSQVVKVFFDTKYLEIADTFRESADPEVFDKLSELDPAHKQDYDEAVNSRK